MPSRRRALLLGLALAALAAASCRRAPAPDAEPESAAAAGAAHWVTVLADSDMTVALDTARVERIERAYRVWLRHDYLRPTGNEFRPYERGVRRDERRVDISCEPLRFRPRFTTSYDSAGRAVRRWQPGNDAEGDWQALVPATRGEAYFKRACALLAPR